MSVEVVEKIKGGLNQKGIYVASSEDAGWSRFFIPRSAGWNEGFFFFYFEAFLPNNFLIERSGKTLRQADCGFQ